MRKPQFSSCLLISCMIPFGSQMFAQNAADYKEGEIIVHSTATEIQRLNDQIGATIIQTYNNVPNIYVIELPANISVPEAIELYEPSPQVLYAEPNYFWEALQLHPNDTYYADGTLWGLNNTGQKGGTADADVDGPEGWGRQNTSPNVVVSVIDTGTRYTHEDLAGNMWVNPNETPGNGNDDDGNGYVDDVHGIDAIDDDGDPSPGSFDPDGHGSHVSGTIGGEGNNGLGIVGTSWDVQLMACRFLTAPSDSLPATGTTADAIQCIDYSIDQRVDVINASWGGGPNSKSLREMIAECRNYGIQFVAAAGNNSNDNDMQAFYPASYDLDNVISVAATTWNDLLAVNYSNTGLVSVDLGAPGGEFDSDGTKADEIFSAWHDADNDYEHTVGTSMAAPHVAGGIALLKAKYPFMAYFHRQNRMFAGTDPLPALDGITVTGGRLNMDTMLVTHTDHPPINDDFSDATEIKLPAVDGEITAVGNNIDATKESGEDNHAGFPGGKSIWWYWTAPENMTVTMNTGGSGFGIAFDTLLAVYTGTSVSSLTLVDEAKGNYGVIWSQVSFQATSGTTYRIAVDVENAVEGNVKLTIQGSRPVWPAAFGIDPGAHSLVRDSANNQCEFEVFGPAFAEVKVEYSTDLNEWANLHPSGGTYTLNSSGFLTVTDSSAPESVKYYRAQSQDSEFTYSIITVGYAEGILPLGTT